MSYMDAVVLLVPIVRSLPATINNNHLYKSSSPQKPSKYAFCPGSLDFTYPRRDSSVCSVSILILYRLEIGRSYSLDLESNKHKCTFLY